MNRFNCRIIGSRATIYSIRFKSGASNQSGSIKTDPNHSGSDQTGPKQSGPNQTDPILTGPNQSGPKPN